MKKHTILAAIAPIAMLAACGDDAETVDTMEAPEVETTTEADTVSDDSQATDVTPSTIEDAGDFSGTYNFTDSTGTPRSVTLDSAAGTYSYTAENGETRTGNYTVADDGYRFTIEDYYGEPGYFTFWEGNLVRLPDDTALSGDTITVSGERYARDDAPFSRDPELGSPVVPDDMTGQ